MDKLVSGCIRSPQTLIQNFLDNIFQGVEDNIVPIPLHHVVSNRSCLKNKSISTFFSYLFKYMYLESENTLVDKYILIIIRLYHT